jgi:hypothetical protein
MGQCLPHRHTFISDLQNPERGIAIRLLEHFFEVFERNLPDGRNAPRFGVSNSYPEQETRYLSPFQAACRKFGYQPECVTLPRGNSSPWNG